MRVFISHSTHDREFVDSVIIATLRRIGIQTWYSKEDITATERWERSILNGLETCDWFILVMSDRASTSEWVIDEVHWAMDHREGRILPLRIDECDPLRFHIRMPRIQNIDFRSDREAAIASLTEFFLNRRPHEGVDQGVNPPARDFAGGQEVTVSNTMKADFSSIGEAMLHSDDRTRIRVRPGTYRESLVIEKSVLIEADGPPDEVVIVGEDSSCMLVKSGRAVMRGFTLVGRSGTKGLKFHTVNLQEGSPLLERCIIRNDSLSGINVAGANSTPEIRGCTIFGSPEFGVRFVRKAHGIVEDCDISGNQSAEIAIFEGSEPVIRRCMIHGGPGVGIAVQAGGLALLEDSDVFETGQGGVLITRGSSFVIRECRIFDNKTSGVMIHGGSRTTIEDADIFGNADHGIWINSSSDTTIRQSRIFGSVKNGLIYQDGSGKLEACDISGNGMANIAVTGDSSPTVIRCHIREGKNCGVFVESGGRGSFEDCDINGNAMMGVVIAGSGNPFVSKCRINGNKMEAVRVFKNGAGRFEGCDLTNNQGVWSIEPGSDVHRDNNRES